MCLLAGVGDAPDGVGHVVGDVESAVRAGDNACGTSPDGAVCVDEAGHEVFILAGGYAVLQANANQLVAGAHGLVPGAVRANEKVAAILCGELLAGVEVYLQRSKMRLQQGVADDGFGREFRMAEWQGRLRAR